MKYILDILYRTKNILSRYGGKIFMGNSINTFRQIRDKYDLQAKNMADIVGIAYRNYQNYENGSVTPFKKLCIIADFFAVSLDWLVGRSSDAYNDSVISLLESNCKYNRPNHKSDGWFLDRYNMYALKWKDLHKDYLNEKRRKEKFTLEARAEILTYINLLDFYSRFEEEDFEHTPIIMPKENMEEFALKLQGTLLHY